MMKRNKKKEMKVFYRKYKSTNCRIAAVLCTSALTLALAACGTSGQGNAMSAELFSTDTETADSSDAQAARKLSAGQAAEALEKQETVSVKADALGHPQKTTVETTLILPETGDVVRDKTNLENIKNTDGDEEYELQKDGTLVWENQGEDISYEGSTKEELPVAVKVSYYLDGKRISPADLAGKSGAVKICFDYENRTSVKVSAENKEVEVPVPFLMLSMAVLPKEHFSNVEVTKGKLITIGDETIAVGYALPGVEDALKLGDYEPTEEMEIPASVEITADAVDFELEFTETIASTGLFADLDTEKLEDVDDLVDSMDDFKEGSGKLVDGVGKMLDGSNAFRDYLEQYTDGAGALSDHMDSLASGLSALDENTSDLVNGSKAVADGIALLESEISGMESELAALMEQQSKAAQELTRGAEEVKNAAESVNQKAGEVSRKAYEVYKKAGEVNSAIGEVDHAADKINAKTEEINRKIEEINQAAEEINAAKEEGEEAIAAISPIEGVSVDQISAVEFDLGEMDASDSGASKASDSEDQSKDGDESVSAQIEAYTAQIAALKAALAQLKEGSAAVNEGLTAYGNGVHQATVGAGALAKGGKTLSDSGAALNEGYRSMCDGLAKLNDGIIEFDKEGVQNISKLAGKDLQNVITGLKALKESDTGYTNFGGIRDGVKGSVRFMIETEEIK